MKPHLLSESGQPQIKDLQAATSSSFPKAGLSLILAVLAMLPQLAFAAPWDKLGDKILEALNGGIARTIAIICVMALGFVAMTGNMPWRWALSLIAGIVLVFGAASLVDIVASAVTS